jgi:hypothetical protein
LSGRNKGSRKVLHIVHVLQMALEVGLLLWKVNQCQVLCIHTENYMLSIEGDMYVASTVSRGNIKENF